MAILDDNTESLHDQCAHDKFTFSTEISEGKLYDVRTSSSTISQAETTSDSDQCSVRTQITNSQANTPATDIIIDPPPLYDVCDGDDGDGGTSGMISCNATAARPSFLDLSAPQGKPHFQFCSVDSEGEYTGDGNVILAEAERGRLAEPSYDDDRNVTVLSSDEHDNDLPSEPASMPPVLSSTSSTSTAAFSYKNPAYQSANPACGGAASDPAVPKSKATHSSDQDIPGNYIILCGVFSSLLFCTLGKPDESMRLDLDRSASLVNCFR
jgi:hypothetical protein